MSEGKLKKGVIPINKAITVKGKRHADDNDDDDDHNNNNDGGRGGKGLSDEGFRLLSKSSLNMKHMAEKQKNREMSHRKMDKSLPSKSNKTLVEAVHEKVKSHALHEEKTRGARSNNLDKGVKRYSSGSKSVGDDTVIVADKPKMKTAQQAKRSRHENRELGTKEKGKKKLDGSATVDASEEEEFEAYEDNNDVDFGDEHNLELSDESSDEHEDEDEDEANIASDDSMQEEDAAKEFDLEESSSEENDVELRPKTFAQLGLKQWLVTQCQQLGMKKPTEIQQETIPAILQGRNVVGCAQTGSGKTAAFALPILHKLSDDPYGIFALVLTPTRELAFQIAEQFRALGHPIGLRVTVIVGGVDMLPQALELSKRPHIVIATPGRLVDHINSNSDFSLSLVKFLVLDEADRLLDQGFSSELQQILDALGTKKRQTLLYSATITQNLSDLESMSISNIYHFEAKRKTMTVETLDQRYILVPANVKDCYLVHLLKKNESNSIIIFTGTCLNCETILRMIKELGFRCVSLHSQMTQYDRLGALAKFRARIINILVATDVASRGLDIPVVKLVINHDTPASATDYIHRVGRTARAGRGGQAITLVTQYDVELVQKIEAKINIRMLAYKVDEDEVLNHLEKVVEARRAAAMYLAENNFGEKRSRNKAKKESLLNDSVHAEARVSHSSSAKGGKGITRTEKKI